MVQRQPSKGTTAGKLQHQGRQEKAQNKPDKKGTKARKGTKPRQTTRQTQHIQRHARDGTKKGRLENAPRRARKCAKAV